MTPTAIIALGREALYIALLVAAPMFLAALATGLLISILQAATQINEATLSFVPKLVIMFATLVVMGPWMVTLLTDYIRRLYESIPNVIG
jgi:flagellar biosynthesis protein FliQ